MERVEAGPGIVPVDNETQSSTTRTTADGKKITYRMTVLQQPARARACGQGAKSSADRRPVDPPPIIELKIFEGENAENDITFTTHVEFFLFAELENARTVAQGRVGQDRSNPPVLTGTPVSGIVYLDRPSPAGYFLFPDLSVRHEGKYRLSFSLYEEDKSGKLSEKHDGSQQPLPAGEAHVNHRLEVKSQPFHVYSAKKFPGLMESTSLSRVVAEQGCRVRIRRDVRMRRRDAKGSAPKDWDEYEDETAAARARMSATPDPSLYSATAAPHPYVDPVARPRSASNTSHHSVNNSLSRRPSLQDLNSPYPSQQQQTPYANGPQTPHSGYVQNSPYGASPAQPFQQPMMVPQQPAMMQPPALPALPAPYQTQPSSYPYGPGAGATSQYGTPTPAHELAPRPQRSSVEYAPQLPSDAAAARSASQYMPYPPPQPMAYSQQQPSMYSPSVGKHSRPASLDARPPPSAWSNGSSNSTYTRSGYDLPPLNTALGASRPLEVASSPLSGPAADQGSAADGNNKRAFASVFNDRHQHQPFRNGARPATPPGPSGDGGIGLKPINQDLSVADDADDDDDDAPGWDLGSLGMHYRRADGRRIIRALPQS